MKSRSKLKNIRVALSLVFLISTTFIFLDIYNISKNKFDFIVLFYQFVPSLIKFLTVFTVFATGFIFILVLTLLFGRVYCSTVCPLGIMQDVIIFFSRKSKIKIKFRKQRTYNYVRYSILIIVFLSFAAGSMLAVDLLDPYSNFGRILSNLFRPYIVDLNNLLTELFFRHKIIFLHIIKTVNINSAGLIFAFAFLIILLLFSVFSGRLYCNTICPVGTLLGFLSKVSIFKINFSKEKCTSCGNCVKVCKAGCIDMKEQKVDMSRCVACYNCIKECPASGIKYYYHHKKATQNSVIRVSSKREFLQWSGILLAGLFISSCVKTTKININKKLVPFRRKTPVSPPGSLSIKHFTSHCTACQLCISSCPSHVLQPAMLEYNVEGILQPTMNYEKSFCNYNCTVCSQVCPSGAILPVEINIKQRIQLGMAGFIKQNCIVFNKETDCGACSEACPTKACDMVPYKTRSAFPLQDMVDAIPQSNVLKIPKVDTKICIGCGACEYACPVLPDKAIIVEGNPVHLKAGEPKKEKSKKIDYKGDFPF